MRAGIRILRVSGFGGLDELESALTALVIVLCELSEISPPFFRLPTRNGKNAHIPLQDSKHTERLANSVATGGIIPGLREREPTIACDVHQFQTLAVIEVPKRRSKSLEPQTSALRSTHVNSSWYSSCSFSLLTREARLLSVPSRENLRIGDSPSRLSKPPATRYLLG